jgi:hypothetical protein
MGAAKTGEMRVVMAANQLKLASGIAFPDRRQYTMDIGKSFIEPDAHEARLFSIMVRSN